MKPNNVVFDPYCDWQDLFTASSQVEINGHARVSLVDFGLSEKYMLDGVHIPLAKINRTLGNKFFMSLSQLRKWASGRRDDLEQLIYTLAFLAKGDLPWSLKRAYATDDVLRAKATPAVVAMVFDDLPE